MATSKGSRRRRGSGRVGGPVRSRRRQVVLGKNLGRGQGLLRVGLGIPWPKGLPELHRRGLRAKTAGILALALPPILSPSDPKCRMTGQIGHAVFGQAPKPYNVIEATCIPRTQSCRVGYIGLKNGRHSKHGKIAKTVKTVETVKECPRVSDPPGFGTRTTPPVGDVAQNTGGSTLFEWLRGESLGGSPRTSPSTSAFPFRDKRLAARLSNPLPDT